VKAPIRAAFATPSRHVDFDLQYKLLMLLSDLILLGIPQRRLCAANGHLHAMARMSDIQVLERAFLLKLSANSRFLDRKQRVTPVLNQLSVAAMLQSGNSCQEPDAMQTHDGRKA